MGHLHLRSATLHLRDVADPGIDLLLQRGKQVQRTLYVGACQACGVLQGPQHWELLRGLRDADATHGRDHLRLREQALQGPGGVPVGAVCGSQESDGPGPRGCQSPAGELLHNPRGLRVVVRPHLSVDRAAPSQSQRSAGRAPQAQGASGASHLQGPPPPPPVLTDAWAPSLRHLRWPESVLSLTPPLGFFARITVCCPELAAAVVQMGTGFPPFVA